MAPKLLLRLFILRPIKGDFSENLLSLSSNKVFALLESHRYERISIRIQFSKNNNPLKYTQHLFRCVCVMKTSCILFSIFHRARPGSCMCINVVYRDMVGFHMYFRENFGTSYWMYIGNECCTFVLFRTGHIFENVSNEELIRPYVNPSFVANFFCYLQGNQFYFYCICKFTERSNLQLLFSIVFVKWFGKSNFQVFVTETLRIVLH